MSIEAWWPRLRRETQAWLEDNNGDVVPSALVDEIAEAGGVVSEASPWVGEIRPDGLVLSGEAVDWIEAVANAESPGPHSGSW